MEALGMFHGINFPRLWKKGTGRSQRVEDQLCILGGFLRTLKELHSNEGQWVDSKEGVQAQRQRSVGGGKLIYTFTATMVWGTYLIGCTQM